MAIKTKVNENITGNGARIVNAVINSSPELSSTLVRAGDNAISAKLNENGIVEYSQTDLNWIGTQLNQFTALRNEFINTLYNRWALVVLISKTWTNKLQVYKKGLLEMGDNIAEYFIEMCEAHEFDPADAENAVFKREIPDVQSAFHTVNWQLFYKQTVSKRQLQRAFTTFGQLEEFISGIISRMYTSLEVDEYITTVYLLAQALKSGYIKPVQIPAVIDKDSGETLITAIKSASYDMEYPRTDNNVAGVMNFSNKAEQAVLLNTNVSAFLDVRVMAAAFHLNELDFVGSGRRVEFNGFDILNSPRANKLIPLFDKNYKPLTKDEINELNSVAAVVHDMSLFMIFDNMIDFGDIYNPQAVYWNNNLVAFKTFSLSPFAPAYAFVQGKPEITEITLTPSAVTISAGQTAQLSADVKTKYFASANVTYSSNNENVTVTSSGLVYVSPEANTGDTATITVTSVYDSTKTATATITVA